MTISGVERRRLVLDVTSLGRLGGARPTGIERIQLLVAVHLLERPDVVVELTRFDAEQGRYVEVAADELRAWVGRATGPTLAPAGGAGPAPARDMDRPRGVHRLLARRPAAAEALGEALGHARAALGHARKALVALRRPAPAPAAPPCQSGGWDARTTYWSLGLDHRDNDLGHLARQRAVRGFRTVLVVHDVIAVRHPEWVTDELDGFDRHVAAVAGAADLVVTPSAHGAADLAGLLAERGWPAPPIEPVAPPTAGDPDRSPPASSEPRPPAGFDVDRPFALVVGTVEARKNHALVLDVWEALIADPPPGGVPHLVVVGRRGWLAEGTWRRLERSPVLAPHVTWLTDADDAELAWLYAHARLALVPSFAEGWGLPVSEALAAGVVCLSSDRTSLPEAGEGLTELLDPLDRAAWEAAVRRWWTDDQLRAERQARIAAEHRPRTAAAYVDAVLALLDRHA